MILKNIDPDCDHLTIEEFLNEKFCMILGEDGSAYYATKDKCSIIPVLSYKEIEWKEYPAMFTHICWFNK